MKVFAIFAVLLVAIAAEEEFCYKNVLGACQSSTKKVQEPIKCNAKYGAIEHIMGDLQAYVSSHIARSYEYLMLSTHYGNYERNRAGFEKLFRDLSDSKWHKAIELIKYITKRGGAMDFENHLDESSEGIYELYELPSLAFALDTEKKLALKANKIHREATGRNQEYHDPEISSYIEEEFSHKQAEEIRKLSGYSSDLYSILNGPDAALGLYIFDEYLQKQ